MRRTIVVSVILTLVSASTLLSQEPERRRPAGQTAFQQLFTIQGVEFSEEQQIKVDEIRTRYLPTLTELQNDQMGVFTDEQRQARQKAYRAAREAGKAGVELREVAEAAFVLTAEQKKQRTAEMVKM